MSIVVVIPFAPVEFSCGKCGGGYEPYSIINVQGLDTCPHCGVLHKRHAIWNGAPIDQRYDLIVDVQRALVEHYPTLNPEAKLRHDGHYRYLLASNGFADVVAYNRGKDVYFECIEEAVPVTSIIHQKQWFASIRFTFAQVVKKASYAATGVKL